MARRNRGALRLRGSVAIVTGASRGIGVHVAKELASHGVHLVLAARSLADLERTAAEVTAMGVRAVAVPTDVTKRGHLENLVAAANRELGPVDILVNNAGVEQLAHFATLDPDVIESILRTNLVAVELLTRFALPDMIRRRRGHIVNLSSLSGKTAYPYSTVYASSKHGVVGFSWSLREELRPYNVGVSVICPTHVADVGVFAHRHPDNQAPSLAAPVSPEKVARAVVNAIDKNRSEILIAKGLGNWVDLFQAISPDLTARVARLGGVYRFLARDASKNTPAP